LDLIGGATFPEQSSSSSCGGIIKHSVGWNGHYLIGYAVAVTIAFLLGAQMVTVHDPDRTSTSFISSLSGPVSVTPKSSVPAPTIPASSCGKFLEAILTGSEADITASLQVIRADKTAEPTAREFAKHYSDRAQGETSRRKTDVGIVKDYCSR
jgi:hypothetical protein